jgi:hypothetical protein
MTVRKGGSISLGGFDLPGGMAILSFSASSPLASPRLPMVGIKGRGLLFALPQKERNFSIG